MDLLACVLEVAVARITQATPDQLLLLVSNQSPANPFFLEKPAFVYYNSYCAQVVLSAKPLVVINTELDGRSEHNSDVTLGMLAYEGLPLFWPSGELFGTLAVLDKTPRTFTPLQEQLLQHFKEGCESELKILFNESHERADSIHSSQNVLFQKLVSVVHAASANSNLLATLQNAMEVVASITSAEYGSMIVLNEKGAVTDNIIGLNAWGLDIKEAIYSSLIEYGLAGWVFRQREVALVSDTLTDSRWLRLPEQPSQARSALVVPVMRGELLAGIMVLLHSQPSHFGVEQIKLIVPASEHLALLLDNIRLQGLARQEKESRQSTESQLYLSEGRYQAISEMTSDFAFSLVINSNGSFEVEWVTDAFFRVTNYSLEELMKPEGWKLLVHPDDAAQAVRYAKSVMAGHAGVVEFRIITRRGEVRWVRLYVKREWDTEKRKLIRILGAGQDITEQKQAEEALQHANEELNGWVSELEQHTREIGLLNEM
ncbi:MAG TPA: GAF domain-containing protein, partial [Chloroflexia bacterium]|nr:GAF domain-containing protein [Chloroflexia bacterium]